MTTALLACMKFKEHKLRAGFCYKNMQSQTIFCLSLQKFFKAISSYTIVKSVLNVDMIDRKRRELFDPHFQSWHSGVFLAELPMDCSGCMYSLYSKWCNCMVLTSSDVCQTFNDCLINHNRVTFSAALGHCCVIWHDKKYIPRFRKAKRIKGTLCLVTDSVWP